ncbi:hypothetical protein MRX96_037835 [Rhipicephalus microplus]
MCILIHGSRGPPFFEMQVANKKRGKSGRKGKGSLQAASSQTDAHGASSKRAPLGSRVTQTSRREEGKKRRETHRRRRGDGGHAVGPLAPARDGPSGLTLPFERCHGRPASSRHRRL